MPPKCWDAGLVEPAYSVKTLLGRCELSTVNFFTFEGTDPDRLIEPTSGEGVIFRSQAKSEVYHSLKTGDVATDLIRAAYGEDFTAGGVGRTLMIEAH